MEMSEIYNGSQCSHDIFLVNKAGATEYITEMSEIYNGSQCSHDIFLVNKAGATEYITGRPSTLFI